MKRLFYVLTLILCLSSCIYDRSTSQTSHNESSTTGVNIVGEWIEYDANDPNAEDYLTPHYVFQAGGSGYWRLMGDLYNPKAERARGQFRWTQNGNTITITENDGNIFQFAVHDNELVRTGGLGVEVYRKK